ncbi:T9SS type A sorting domain-containing protein [Spirosoma fluviale]|uniref:Por secretion system C-terminal sorting domain-containing protein n=1 Tax=Spirosoma fluviale TaxID=1597977 RepID=A0A286FBB9_9BACT|nr:T9SS type A sorting domain-containing protein [Spirosoma fluviale]SOD80144.1 Por secretion system C-terminal sorting domain-containing protein [Spirosoma fluviale]
MKQIILIGVLMGLLTAVAPLQAQVAQRDSDARKGSRLELGRTSSVRKPTTGLPTQRFSIAPSPSLSGLDRSMALHKNSAINEHYRSIMMTHSGAKIPTHATAAESVPTVESAPRTSAIAQEGKAENRLYTNEKLWVSNAYPNPADDVAEIDYQFNGTGDAKLVLLNVLGAPVAEYELERNERKVRIGTRLLDTGYYLYQLSVDGKKVATKRLLVRHQ